MCTLTEFGQTISVLHDSASGLFFTSSVHTHAIFNWKEGCTGCRRRRYVLMEESGSPTTQFLFV